MTRKLLWILEDPFLSIPLDPNLEEKALFITSICWCGDLMAYGHGFLIYKNGKWVISSWTSLRKEKTFNNPCENVFFVIEFDLQEDRDLILTLGL